MKELLERCAGLDIHRDTIVTCIMIGFGQKMKKEIKTFKTTTDQLLSLAEWLKVNQIRDAAMESTGVYWIPIFTILERDGLTLSLANAKHIKNVPGRKTDVKDSEWLCKLLKNGLIEASFVPPAEIRQLRSLMRYRKKLTQEISRAKNRVIKNLEAANIKMASVFSDVFGASGWKIIKAIAAGEERVEKLMQFVGNQIKTSYDDIRQALSGILCPEDLPELNLKIKHIEALYDLIKLTDETIQAASKPFVTEIQLLEEIPGVSFNSACTILAEIGTNMHQFHSEDHLASWAGLAPGNNESAGKKKSTAINEGNKHLKTILVEAAWSVSKVAKTYFSTVYKRLKIKRGSKRALIAVARKILITIYWMIGKKKAYKELGADYVDPHAKKRKLDYFKRKLEELGCDPQLISQINITA